MTKGKLNRPIRKSVVYNQKPEKQKRYKSKRSDDLIYSVFHDLRAPVRATHNLLQLIGKDPADNLSIQSQKALESAKQRMRDMEVFIKDMLAYYLSEPDNALTLVDTRELIFDVIAMLEVPNGFSFKLPPDLPTLFTPKVPLFQVLHNLISNALSHHHNPEEGCLSISWRENGEFLEFSVSDNGPGILKEDQAKLFEATGLRSSKDRLEFKGLGLTIIKKLVDSNGGKINVDSSLEKGTTFVFTWPLYPEHHLVSSIKEKESVSYSSDPGMLKPMDQNQHSNDNGDSIIKEGRV